MAFTRVNPGDKVRTDHINDVYDTVEEMETSVAAVTPENTPATGDVLTFGTVRGKWADPGVLYAANYSGIQTALDAAAAAGADGKTGATVVSGKGQVETDETVVVRDGAVWEGQGIDATELIPSAAFPDNTPLVQMGNGTDVYDHGNQVHGLTINANGVTGSSSVVGTNPNEPTGLFNVVVKGFMDRGVYIHSDGAQEANHFVVEDCIVMATNTALTNPTVEFASMGNPATIRRSTITVAGTVNSATALKVDDAIVISEALHLEYHDDGVVVEQGAGVRGAFLSTVLSGHTSIGTLVSLSDDANVVLSTTNPLGSTVTLAHSATGESITGSIPHYSNKYVRPRTTTITSNLVLSGGQRLYWDIVYIDATAGDRKIDLPSAALHPGKELLVVKVDSTSNRAGVRRFVGTTISGQPQWNITTQYGWVKIVAYGSNWIVIGQGGTLDNVEF